MLDETGEESGFNYSLDCMLVFHWKISGNFYARNRYFTTKKE